MDRRKSTVNAKPTAKSTAKSSEKATVKPVAKSSARPSAEKSRQKTGNVGRGQANLPKWRPEMAFKENTYYTAISKKYRKFKFISIVVTIVFVLGMITVFGKEITVDNLKYLIKDLDISSLKNSDNYNKIIYDAPSNPRFGFFKGDLAVVGAGSTKLFGASGSSVFTKSNSFYDPVLLTSDKYMIVYDKGDTSCTYTVYNAFSELKTEKLDYPISSASVSDNGYYAIVTRASDYKGSVLVYNDDFESVFKLRKDKYIMSCELSPDGKKLACISVYDEAGKWMGEVSLYDITSTEPKKIIGFDEEVLLKCGFRPDGGFGVLTNKQILFYDAKGDKISSLDVSSNYPIICDFDGEYTFAVFNDNVIGSDKSIVIMNGKGETVYKKVHTGEITTERFDQDTCYVLFDEKVERLDIPSGEVRSVSIDPNCLSALSYGDGKLLLCYSGSAIPLDFSKATESEEPVMGNP